MVIIEKPSLPFIIQFLLGLGIAIAYIPGILGASVPTGWFYLIIVSPLLVIPTSIPLFLVYVLVSLLWTINTWIATLFLLQFISLWLIFEFGKTIKDLRSIFKGIAFGLGINSVIAFAQYNGYTGIYTLNNSVAGLFLNPNIYSEVSAVILVALIWLRLWYWIPVTLPGLILVHSRTAILALGVGLLVLLPNRYKWTTLLLVPIGYILFKNYFNISSIQERLDLWADTIRGLSIFGNGVGSFEILYPKFATHIDTSIARPRYAHNDLLQLVFEFGIGTLLLLPIFYKVIKSGSAILYSLGIVSLLTFPFHVPLFAFIGCLVTGFIISNNATVRNSRNTCRSILSKRNTS